MTRAAELLVTGRIATLAGDVGLGWVEAIAIAGGRVVAHGRVADLEGLVGPRTRHLALGPGEAVVPALTDAHLHLLDAALAEDRLDLSGLPPPVALARIAAAHAALQDPDAWLEGDGWDVDGWGAWPDAADLERVAPRRRAAFWAHDRHALWASARALEEAGLTAASADPGGGVIRRRDDGSLGGVLHETAAALVLATIPPPTAARRTAAVAALAERLAAVGLGAVHDPGAMAESGIGGVGVYRALEAAGRLPIRVLVSIRREALEAAVSAEFRSGDALVPDRGPEGTRASFGWLKLFADGTLGSRTAAMLDPFEGPIGQDGGRGLFQLPRSELASLARRAAGAGIATQIHAIGDAAVRVALDALAPLRDVAALWHRVEHAQLVDAADLGRFATSGVVASVQPVHLRSDAATARLAWGDRAERGYPYGSILRAGGVLAFGTDAPIEPWDPWPGLEAAVTRRSPAWPAGTPALGAGEALDLAEALRAATVGPALAALDRRSTRSLVGHPGGRSGGSSRGQASAGSDSPSTVGRLVTGARADLLVIGADALVEPVEAGGPLGRVRPRLVLLGGREVGSR